jgi:hypothetical protein
VGRKADMDVLGKKIIRARTVPSVTVDLSQCPMQAVSDTRENVPQKDLQAIV